jgi:hypothetical protein
MRWLEFRSAWDVLPAPQAAARYRTNATATDAGAVCAELNSVPKP